MAMLLSAPVARAEEGILIYGVSESNELVRFFSASPGQIDQSVAISGLQPGEQILAHLVFDGPAANASAGDCLAQAAE